MGQKIRFHGDEDDHSETINDIPKRFQHRFMRLENASSDGEIVKMVFLRKHDAEVARPTC